MQLAGAASIGGGRRASLPLLLGILGLLATAPQVVANVHANADIIVENANRELDLTSHVAILREELTLKHTGQKAAAGIVTCTSSQLAARLAFLELRQLRTDRENAEQPILQTHSVKVEGSPSNVACRAAVLDTVMKSGDVVSVESYAVFTKVMEPLLEGISLDEVQRVQFQDHVLLVTPYVVSRQTLMVRLPSATVESYTKEQPVKQQGSTLSYGPFPKKMPWTFTQLSVDFPRSAPFLEVPQLERTIVISPWGLIHVKDSYFLKNGGAKLNEEWLNLTYSDSNSTTQIEVLKMDVPSAAHSFYYQDELGNISSLTIIRSGEKARAILRPRLPLSGGSSLHFTFGYQLPTETHLWRTSRGHLRLTMPIGCALENAAVDSMTVKVVLPEGAKNIKVSLPFPARTSAEKRYTYLATGGSPVKIITLENVIWMHNNDFSVDYTFNSVLMAQEPMLLSTMLMLLFGLAIASSRLDWTSGKAESSATPNATQLRDCMQQVQAILRNRESIFKKLDSLAATRDVDAIKTDWANVEGELDSSLGRLKDLQADIRQLDAKDGQTVESVYLAEKDFGTMYRSVLADKVTLLEKRPRNKNIDKDLKQMQASLDTARKQAGAKRVAFQGAARKESE